MFETGRWRRYYSERAFLENIREAKRAVKNWRALSRGEAIEKRLEISFVADDDEFTLPRPPQKQADQSVMTEPPITFEPIPSLAPTFETVMAAADIVVPEQTLAQDEAIRPYEAAESHDADSEDSDLPADIILPDFVSAMPRIDMVALEDALNLDMMSQAPVAQDLYEQDLHEQDAIEDDRIEDEPPVLDLDAIARKYPALRHAQL